MDKLLINKITDEDFKIWMHHIGGIGDCGPIEMFNMLKDDVLWTFYDVDKESLDNTLLKNKVHRLVNKGIGGKDEMAKFNILSSPSASSCLLPAKSAKNYVIQGTEETWGDHTKLIKTIDVQLNKLDTLAKKGEIGKIDFLSVDAQGLELDILKGAQDNLSDVLGVVCEVEFRELYENQPLFYKTFEYMHDQGFNLWALYNMQHFNNQPYPKLLRGYGMLTVAEVLFVKDPEILFERLKSAEIDERTRIVTQLIKMSIFGVIFNQRDFTIDILHRLEEMGICLKDYPETKVDYIKKLEASMEVIRTVFTTKIRWDT